MSLFRSLLLLLVPLALCACGFTPVYAPGGTGAAVQGQIEVNEPETRNAYLLTQRLEERLGRASEPKYTLTVDVRARREDIAVDQEGTITRFNLTGEADYVLVELETGRVLTSGTADNFTSFSTTGTTVSQLAAERDAQKRLMVLLADQIAVRVLSTDVS